MEDFYKFFVKELRDMYSSEQQIIKALPEMIKEAPSPELQEALQHHLEETRHQVKRLEEIGKELKESLQGETCKAMQGLIQEGKEALQSPFKGSTKDAAIISACRRIEHYEMAAYQGLKTFADYLELSKIEELLGETLEEEENAEETLASLVETALFSSELDQKSCKHCGK